MPEWYRIYAIGGRNMEQRKRGRHRNDCECDWCKQRKAQLAAKSFSKPAEDVGLGG